MIRHSDFDDNDAPDESPERLRARSTAWLSIFAAIAVIVIGTAIGWMW